MYYGFTWRRTLDRVLAIEDAKKVCEKLGITHVVYELQKDFKCMVIQNFIREYTNAKNLQILVLNVIKK